MMKIDEDIREMTFSNIVLAGGNTLFPGIAARLAKEMKLLLPAPGGWKNQNF